MEQTMKIQNQVTMDDLIAFNRYFFRNSASIQRQRRVRVRILIIGSAVLLVGGILAGTLMHSYGVEGLAVFMGLLCLFSVRRNPERAVDETVRNIYGEGRNAALFRPYVLELSEEGIINNCDICEAKYAWAAIEKVVSQESHLFIFTG